ncbi:cytochrome P450 [uncultured Mycobacterium sp.]|uniref:cytochrome P450 n=1 Tax=uncultured Mycobacterium sp. TaxID=171292 RepID=UPI0035CC8967
MRNRYDVDTDPLITETAIENPQTDIYEKLLHTCPVFDRGDNSPLLISRRDDIVFLNQHPAVLGNGDAGPLMGATQRLIPLDIDGEEHTRFRRLLDPLFAPKAKTSQIANLEPVVRRLANSLIDEFVDAGEVELFSAFCVPLPTIIFVDLLGLPQRDRPFFLQFKDDIVHANAGSPEANAQLRMDAAMRMFGYLTEQLQLRENDPDSYPGLLTGLLHAEVDGQRLQRQELLNIFLLLVIAGLDTVTGALSCMFCRLARFPDEQRQLRDDPSLIVAAVEELLRWESPVQWGHRLATEDLTLPSGYQLQAGDHLQLLWAAGNIDETACPAAMQVKLDRAGNRHIAFASGAHRCLGSHLARMELRCALDEFHRRIGEYRIKPGEMPRYPGGTVRTVAHLPLVFEPA